MSAQSSRSDDSQQQARPGTRVYRARTLDEVLPRIRDELGPDAVVVGQRETLGGGFAGFFQRPVVEVAARAGGGSRVDVYDDGDDRAEAPAAGTAERNGESAPRSLHGAASAAQEGLRSEAIQRLLAQAAPFAEQLSVAADEQARAEPAAAGPPEQPGVSEPGVPEPGVPEPGVPEPGVPEPGAEAEPLTAEVALDGRRPPSADAIEARLVAGGIPPALAADIVAETISHTLPFGTPRGLRRLVRSALARRIPVQPSFRGRRRTIAVVGAGGAGKTLCVARLASAYATGSDLPVSVLVLSSEAGAAELAAQLEPHDVPVLAVHDAAEAKRRLVALGDAGVALVDTPSVSLGDREAVAELAAWLRRMRLDEVHLALPATLSRAAADDLLEALEPLGVSRLLLTHTDETTHVGPALGLAVERGLAFSYVSRGSEPSGGMLPADADDLAARALS